MLSHTKEKLETEFRKAGITDGKIDIAAFAANTKELLINKDDICNLANIRRCTVSGWRRFSGQIVDTIYLAGQTYTSYVPRHRFRIDSEAGVKIRQFITEEGLPQITDSTREGLGVRIYVYVSDKQERYALCESYRMYEFSRQMEYVLVPMVSLQVVDEECLERYIDSLFELGIIVQNKGQEHDSLREFLNECSGEYKYRLVLYVASTFAGWRFLQNGIGIQTAQDYDCYDSKIEEVNFYFLGLKRFSQLHESGISLATFFEKMEVDYGSMISFAKACIYILDAVQDTDMKKLVVSLKQIIAECNVKNVKNDVIGKLLTINNIIDEERYRDSVKNRETGIKDRVKGIPLIDIVKALMDKKGFTLAEVMKSVLGEIDYGRASIVAYSFISSTGKQWYTSLIHAGEENY